MGLRADVGSAGGLGGCLEAAARTQKAAAAWVPRRAGGAWPGRPRDRQRAQLRVPRAYLPPHSSTAGSSRPLAWALGIHPDGVERQVLSSRPCAAAAGQNAWLGRSPRDTWPWFCDAGSASRLGSYQAVVACTQRATAAWAPRRRSMVWVGSRTLRARPVGPPGGAARPALPLPEPGAAGMATLQSLGMELSFLIPCMHTKRSPLQERAQMRRNRSKEKARPPLPIPVRSTYKGKD
nr:uncharacterized protein LOC104005939 [Pan troglodytes]